MCNYKTSYLVSERKGEERTVHELQEDRIGKPKMQIRGRGY